MNRHVNAIAGRLSLRPPQRRSLEILDRITEIVPPKKGNDVAAALAEGLGIGRIVVGFNAEEAATFPDNSANFVNKAEEFFQLSTLTGMKILAPTLGMNKTEIVRYGIKLDVPFDLIWSCYQGRSKLCGRCESCLRSVRAYQNAGVWEKVMDRFEGVPK